MISINQLISTPLTVSNDGVWLPNNIEQFSYSDGRKVEKYLDHVFSHCGDLSSSSQELERWIKDWPTQYHLSVNRRHLLDGFTFDPNLSVLEIGAGCGAITRYLGETFEQVVAIEGSLSRATLARKRCQFLDNVHIVCSPFQNLAFRKKFDVIFCIGVFEYSRSFVSAPDPYSAVLSQLSSLLSEDGVLLIAIENQFGLKYFCHSKEDHTNVMFDGIEGYHRFPSKARTFGHAELLRMLSEHFPTIKTYYPYPDYKLPRCVLDEDAFRLENIAELIGNFSTIASPFSQETTPLFNERLTLIELERNGLLTQLSNSFLLTVGKQRSSKLRFEQQGIFYSPHRANDLNAVTKIVQRDINIYTEKKPLSGKEYVESGPLLLRSCVDRWVGHPSIHITLLKLTLVDGATIESLAKAIRPWVDLLRSLAHEDSLLLPGHLIDATWKNCHSDGAGVHFVDQEWEWKEPLHLNVQFIRSAYQF
jgi:SAM-dependent methyltransferase